MDTTYRWLKIGKDFLSSPEIRAMRAQKNGNSMFAAYLQLLVFSLEYDGDLRVVEKYGDFERELSICSGIQHRTLKRLLDYLSARGLLVSGKLVQLPELAMDKEDEDE